MGASCASGKQSVKRNKNNSTTNTNISHSSPKQNIQEFPSVLFDQINKDLGCDDAQDSDKKTCKTLQKYIVSSNDSKSLKSNSSTMCSTTVTTKQNIQIKSTTQTRFTKSVSTHTPHSEQNTSSKKRRVNQLEHFLLERKKYMQQRGVVVYTPYTVLPPPILKSVGSSTLKKKRHASCQFETSLNIIKENRQTSSPTSMLYGDLDSVTIEI